MDLLVLVATAVLFGLSLAYVRGCDHLKGQHS